MLGGKSLANDTSHCGHSLAVDGCLLLKFWRFIWKWPYAPWATWQMSAGQLLTAEIIMIGKNTSTKHNKWQVIWMNDCCQQQWADAWDNWAILTPTLIYPLISISLTNVIDTHLKWSCISDIQCHSSAKVIEHILISVWKFLQHGQKIK